MASLKLLDEAKALAERETLRVVLVNDREDTRIARWYALSDIGQHGVHQHVTDLVTVREFLSLPFVRDGCEMNLCCWHPIEGSRAKELTLMCGDADESARWHVEHEQDGRVVGRSALSERPIQQAVLDLELDLAFPWFFGCTPEPG
ncbi:MAG: hypothetical protein WDO74_22410 [Pseudomonadota bacterium]